MKVTPITEGQQTWVSHQLEQLWGSTVMVSRGVLHQVDQLPGFILFDDDEPAGLITYHIENGACEVVTINAFKQGFGIGAQLITAVKKQAQANGCHRLWLITTNDNIDAIRFYQKRGFTMAALHRNAIAESRKLKPSIPQIGNYGIPIRDEIEFEITLKPL